MAIQYTHQSNNILKSLVGEVKSIINLVTTATVGYNRQQEYSQLLILHHNG